MTNMTKCPFCDGQHERLRPHMQSAHPVEFYMEELWGSLMNTWHAATSMARSVTTTIGDARKAEMTNKLLRSRISKLNRDLEAENP